MTTLPDDLTRGDWEALKRIGRQGGLPAVRGDALLDRLVERRMAAAEDGRLRLTDRGRRAIVRGSPSLWSLCA